MKHRVFVYGSLLSGQHNNRLLASGRLIGRATILGRLYSLGAFPAVRLDLSGPVAGEVWEVDDKTLGRLDELEGVDNGFYARRVVRPTLAGGDAVEAFVYEINADILSPHAEEVHGGDWIEHLQNREKPCQSRR